MKEKSRWFSSLRDLTRKLKVLKPMFVANMNFYSNENILTHSEFCFSQQILKMEQIQLSEEALTYKKCLGDMNDMSSIIQSNCKFTCLLILAFNLYPFVSYFLMHVFFLIVNQQVELHEDLKVKFIKGAKERKELYNKILELKGY